MDNRYFSDKLVKWYEANKRDLPWRETKDPYKVWLSEIILQQTRVNQGMPYYHRFIEKFPDVYALASASEQEVLRLWQGLGYYTRARNLHKCAKQVVALNGGKFPNTFENLVRLPGIGEYTAAAIASFSFKEPVAVVDGNVFRVLSRIFGIETQINSLDGKKVFTALANKLISQKSPDVHNQAIMEFGALHCVPQNPDCINCCFNSTCFAVKNNLQHALPQKLKSKAARKRYFYYLVIRKGQTLAMKIRQEKDIWHGLYDFHLIEKNRPINIEKLGGEVNEVFTNARARTEMEIVGSYRHILTHQVIHSKFIMIQIANAEMRKDKNLKFYTFDKIADLPKPALITRFLTDYKKFFIVE